MSPGLGVPYIPKASYMKSATHSRHNRYPQPTTDQTFHSREGSLGENDHVTAAIGDLYGGDDDDHHRRDGDDQYHHRRAQRRQQQQQQTVRHHHSHSSQTLPVTPPQTPTKSRKSPSGVGSGQPRTPPQMDNTSPSSLSGSSTLRVPGNSPNANQAFPLNNIDYESNPDAVQQELENLQALRRLSMDVSSVANDPDLPSFNNFFPSVAPKGRVDDDDAARLFWVPARLHPELAPKAFKNFVESRVEQIREHEGNLTTDGLQAGPSLRRKKSMLSRQIDTDGKSVEGYEDGADILRRNRSNSEGEQVLTVSELGEVLGKKDPVDLMRQMSLSKAEKALMGEPSQEDDQPIFPGPPPGNSLRRSTRTALRRGSIRKGERVAPSSRRAKLAAADGKPGDEPEFKLSRVRTEPIPSISISSEDEEARPQSASSRQQEMTMKVRSRQAVSPIIPEEPKREAISPPAISQRSVSPPDRPSSERMARSKSEPESVSPPSRDILPPTPPPAKIERKDASSSPSSSSPSSSSQRVLKEPRGGPPNGQLPTPPVAPPLTTSEPSTIKQKRPTLKRGSPGSSSYEPVKEATPSPSPPAPSTQSAEVKRKELPVHGNQQAPPKEVGRKSSWSWLTLGGDGDKEKDKEREGEKGSGGKKVRKAKSMEKDRDRDDEKERKREIKREKEREREREREKERERSGDREHARLDLIQKSLDGPKKRESVDSNLARPSIDSLERERDKEKERASRRVAGSDKEKDKKEPGIFSSIFGGSKKKQEETKSKSKHSNLAVPSSRSKSPPAQTYYYTRFPIHIERAIYRLSHLKLANPRRPLLQQVLLSNFMYAYLAKVQQMQPNAVQGAPQQQQVQQQQSQQQQQQQQQAQQYQQQQLEQQYHQQQQQQQHGSAQANGDETQQLDSDEEDYDFDDDGRDDRTYDTQQGYSARTASREAPNSNGAGYQQDYEGGGYGYEGHEQQYQQEQQTYYQQQQQGGGANGHPGDGGYHDKDYDYYQDHEGYDSRGDERGYEGGGVHGGSVSGNRYHHQQSMNDDRDRDYTDEMW